MDALRNARALTLPSVDGPWAWRSFPDRGSAYRFFQRVAVGDPRPRQLDNAHVAPDGEVLPPGTWVVIYHPIVVGRQRNGDGQAAGDRAA